MIDEGMISISISEYAELVAASTIITILKDYIKTEYPAIDIVKIIMGEE